MYDPADDAVPMCPVGEHVCLTLPPEEDARCGRCGASQDAMERQEESHGAA